jgi:hypothetical protein
MTRIFLSYARDRLLSPLPSRDIALHQRFSALCATARQAVIPL